VQWFVSRWQVEVAVHEVGKHLNIGRQRQREGATVVEMWAGFIYGVGSKFCRAPGLSSAHSHRLAKDYEFRQTVVKRWCMW
jgi:hypothetical protein